MDGSLLNLTKVSYSEIELRIMSQVAEPFQKHLDVCQHCFYNMFNLCPDGRKILNQFTGSRA
jgi:hypothetical protein